MFISEILPGSQPSRDGQISEYSVGRKNLINILIGLAAVVFTLALIESALLIMAKNDALNPFAALGFRLEPDAIRVNELRTRLENYLTNADSANYISDSSTGWTFQPNATLFDGRLTTNSIGIRSAREYSEAPAADTIRLAAFGDSFTANPDVDDDEVWTQVLESELGDRRIRAEVLNFGVGGYGMDQAFLRWQHLGKAFSPDFVIFGFQPENLYRNANVFRPIYARYTGIPLSKPRYHLEDGKLKLVNFPAMPPEDLMEVYQDFDRHPLSAYEFHYDGASPIPEWWPFRRLANLVRQAIASPAEPREGFGPESALGRLGKAIVDAFAADVAKSGASFIVMHLPVQRDLASHHNGGQPSDSFLFEHFAAAYSYLPVEELLGPTHREPRYWGGTGHYGPEINQIIGEALAINIVTCIDEGACPLTRFEGLQASFRIDLADES